MSDDYLWKRRHKILYLSRMFTEYNRKREHFYDGVESYARFAAITGVSAALVGVGVGVEDTVLVFAGLFIFTFTFALAMGFGFYEKARRHSELAERYARLTADIEGRGERGFTEEDLNRWAGALYEIDATHPNTYRALVLICQNQMAIAAGQPDAVVHVPWWRRVTAQLFTHESFP